MQGWGLIWHVACMRRRAGFASRRRHLVRDAGLTDPCLFSSSASTLSSSLRASGPPSPAQAEPTMEPSYSSASEDGEAGMLLTADGLERYSMAQRHAENSRVGSADTGVGSLSSFIESSMSGLTSCST